jgi:hypothetical protein
MFWDVIGVKQFSSVTPVTGAQWLFAIFTFASPYGVSVGLSCLGSRSPFIFTKIRNKSTLCGKSAELLNVRVNGRYGRAMAQAVSRRPPTAEARVRSRISPCGLCGGQSGTGTGFSPSTSVFPCQFHSTGALLLGKGQKIIIIIIIVIFITGLHKKPQGSGASVASAAGPFTAKKKCGRYSYHCSTKC